MGFVYLLIFICYIDIKEQEPIPAGLDIEKKKTSIAPEADRRKISSSMRGPVPRKGKEKAVYKEVTPEFAKPESDSGSELVSDPGKRISRCSRSWADLRYR